MLNQLNTFFINCILNNTPAWSRLTKQSKADFEGYLPSLLSIDKQWQQMSSFHYLLVKYQFKFKNKDYGKTSMDAGLLSLSILWTSICPTFLSVVFTLAESFYYFQFCFQLTYSSWVFSIMKIFRFKNTLHYISYCHLWNGFLLSTNIICCKRHCLEKRATIKYFCVTQMGCRTIILKKPVIKMIQKYWVI